MNDLSKRLTQKKYLLPLFLILSVLIVAFVNWHPGFVFGTGDYRFHINRIEALADSFRHFNFAPKVNQYFIGGYGYASSLFYPDLFLYPFAFLRMLGLPIVISYLLLQVAINFFTFWLTYFAGQKLNFSLKNNLIFTFIYTFSTYRLEDLYSRQDIGELMGMIFLPLVLAELIRFKRGQTKDWYILTLAMTGIGLSHIISLFLAICFAALFVILNLKYFLKKETVINLLKAALLTVGTLAATLLPIIEQMGDQNFIVSTHPLVYIYNENQQLKQLVLNSLNTDVFHARTVNLGILIFVFLVIYSLYNLLTRKNLSLTLIALLLFVACTQYFPWYQLRHSLLATFQFPWRFFSLITLIVAYFIANDDLHLFDLKLITPVLLVGIVVFSGFYGQQTIQATPYRLNSYASYNQISSYLIGAGHEYLPSNSHYEQLLKSRQRKLSFDPDEVTIDKQTISQDIVKFHFNAEKPSAKITLPLFYYKGYQAKVEGAGRASTPKLANNGMTSISLTGKGIVSVQYHYTALQKFGLVVSLLSTFYWLYLYQKRKEEMG